MLNDTLAHEAVSSAAFANGTHASPCEDTPLCSDISAQVMTITPSMAAELFAQRLPNRAVSRTKVRSLVEAIHQGEWRVNGESIILDADLRVLDGQNRLLAIAQAGQTVQALVVVGVPHDAMATIDQGRSRSSADVLRVSQIAAPDRLASAARWLWRYEHGEMRQGSLSLRSSQLPGYLRERPGLASALPWGARLAKLVPAGAGAMAFYLMHARDANLAEAYATALQQGTGLAVTDPAWRVRERLLGDPKRDRVHVVGKLALLILGWGCLRQGKPMPQGASWRGMSDASVPFPRVV